LEPEKSPDLSRAGCRGAADLPGRQCEGGHDTAIDPNGPAVTGRRDLGWDCSEGKMPSCSSIEGHPIRLGRRRPTAPSKLYPSHFGNSHRSDLAAEPSDVALAHGNDAKSLVSACFPPVRSPMGACEVVSHRLAEVTKSLLLDHLRTGVEPLRCRSSLRQLTGLLKVRRRRFAAGAPVVVLIDCQIPDVAGLPTMRAELSSLCGRRQEAKSRHIMTFTPTTDSLSLASLCDGGVVRAQRSKRIRGAR
jgi:hypothetical protein